MALDEMFDADKAWAVQVSVRSAVGATASRAVGEWGEGECQKARMLCSAVASLEEYRQGQVCQTRAEEKPGDTTDTTICSMRNLVQTARVVMETDKARAKP